MKALDITMPLGKTEAPKLNMAFLDHAAMQRIEVQNIIEALEELQEEWPDSQLDVGKQETTSFNVDHTSCKKGGWGSSKVEITATGFSFESEIHIYRTSFSQEKITYYFSGTTVNGHLDTLQLKTFNGKRFSHRTKISVGTIDWFSNHYLKALQEKSANYQSHSVQSADPKTVIAQAVTLLNKIT